MIKLDRREEMSDFDENATDGQQADYFMALESGDHGSWGVGIIEYHCYNCNLTVELIGDYLETYDSLIVNWHNKAKEGDYFSRFVFEYLSFIALLKNKIAIEATSDRQAIQKLKSSENIRNEYLNLMRKDKDLHTSWKSVITELKKSPLYNSSQDMDSPEIDKWWNSDGHSPSAPTKDKGQIHSTKDWMNMVEFWNGVRNNLFHGGKNPNIARDIFLVEHAYKTLSSFMKIQLKKEQ